MTSNIGIDNAAFEIRTSALMIAKNFDALPEDEQRETLLCLEGMASALEELAKRSFEFGRKTLAN